jgi:hypothetical protein
MVNLGCGGISRTPKTLPSGSDQRPPDEAGLMDIAKSCHENSLSQRSAKVAGDARRFRVNTGRCQKEA